MRAHDAGSRAVRSVHGAMAACDRASFAYKNNDHMAAEVKDALANFDLDKTGAVSTSELIAAAKALQEARTSGGEGTA